MADSVYMAAVSVQHEGGSPRLSEHILVLLGRLKELRESCDFPLRGALLM